MPQPPDPTENVYRFGAFRLDERRLLLAVDDAPLALGPKVVETLLALVRRAGKLVTKDELMQRVWPDGFVEEANLTQNVYVLRRVLHAHGLEPAIETAARRGYRFVAPVTLESAPAATGPAVRRAPPALSRRIAAAAALVLGLTALGGATPAAAPRTLALDPDAARAYAMGRYYWNLRTVAGIERSVGYFEDVVRREPRSALGYAGLADAYTALHDYTCDDDPCPPLAAKAMRYAHAAVAREADSAAAHTSLGMTERLFAHDDVRADAEFRRALALDPNDALAHEWYGNLLLVRGDPHRARLELERAVALQPVATATYGWLARAAYYDRRFPDAIAYAREALALNPRRIESQVLLGLALEQNGDAARAVEAFRTLKRIGGEPADPGVLIAGAGARSHDAAALAALRHTIAPDPPDRYAARDLALGLVTAGDYDRALTAMRALRFRNSTDRAFFVLDPRLDPVRADPRFRPWTVP